MIKDSRGNRQENEVSKQATRTRRYIGDLFPQHLVAFFVIVIREIYCTSHQG